MVSKILIILHIKKILNIKYLKRLNAALSSNSGIPTINN